MTPTLAAATAVMLAGVLGLLIGSFLNVVIYRVPRGESIVSPPSACPVCAHPIRKRDNIPVVSYLMLRGRCRDCRAPISARYPMVEASTGIAFAFVTLCLWPGGLIVVVAFLYLAAVSIALTLIDLDVRRLPNAIVLPSILVGFVLLGLAAGLAGDWGRLLQAVVGGAALFAFYFLLAIAYPRGMGFGDVKLAGLLGLYLGFVGWGALVVGAFAAFLLGGVFAVALMVSRKAGRKSGIPFGPWMLAGAWVGVFFGEGLAAGYLSLFGLAQPGHPAIGF